MVVMLLSHCHMLERFLFGRFRNCILLSPLSNHSFRISLVGDKRLHSTARVCIVFRFSKNVLRRGYTSEKPKSSKIEERSEIYSINIARIVIKTGYIGAKVSCSNRVVVIK